MSSRTTVFRLKGGSSEPNELPRHCLSSNPTEDYTTPPTATSVDTDVVIDVVLAIVIVILIIIVVVFILVLLCMKHRDESELVGDNHQGGSIELESRGGV